MKTKQLIIGMAATAMGLGIASQASAVFNPPDGVFTIQLFDGTQAYRFVEDDGPGHWVVLPRPANGAAPNLAPGDITLTTYQVTNFIHSGSGNLLDSQFHTPEGHTLTGVVSDLVMVGGLFPPVAGVGSAFFMDAGNVSHPGQAPGTIGRFELWDNNVNIPVNPENFFDQPGGRPGDATGLPGAPTGMPDFQVGTLLMGGSIVPNFTNTNPIFGPLGDVLVNPIAPPPGASAPEVAFTGSITSIAVLLDSGLWFDQGRIDHVFISATQNIFDTDAPLNPLDPRGANDPYFAGYQVNSSDPIDGSLSTPGIPEPMTAGLFGLSALGLAMSATRRRRTITA